MDSDPILLSDEKPKIGIISIDLLDKPKPNRLSSDFQFADDLTSQRSNHLGT